MKKKKIDAVNESEEKIVEDTVEKEKEKYKLIIVTDRKTLQTKRYFNEHLLKVSKVFNSIDSAYTELMYSMGNIRVVIIESGTGLLSSVQSREDCTDLIKLVDDKIKVNVFYTDEHLYEHVKEELKGRFDKSCWIKYSSSSCVIANMLEIAKNENEGYVLDSDDYDSDLEELNELSLDFIGNNERAQLEKVDSIVMTYMGASDIQQNNDKYEQIKSFERVESDIA